MTIYGAISAPDLAILRAAETHAVNRYLTVIEPQTVMTAQIDQTSFTYPLAQLTIDNVSFGAGFNINDVTQGNDVWIGTSAGERNVFVGRVRKTPGATTLYIEEISAGTSGVPQTHYREIENNHHVTVVRTRSIWEMFPRFENVGGTYVIRKDWDIAYTNQNTTPNPIANITPTAGNPVGFVDASTGKYRITLVGSNSIPVLDGNTITSYSWDIGNGTLVGGALNSSTVTVDFDTGQDWVYLLVTDAKGKTARAWLPVEYYDKANDVWPLPLFDVSSDVRDLRGATISFSGNANNLSLADVPHGAQCYVWAEQYFGGNTTEVTSDYMMGWAISEEISINPQFPDVSFEIVGPVPLLEKVAAIPQRIERAASPANWQEAVLAYTNVKGAAAYLFYWHYRTLAELCDVRLLTGESWQVTNQPGFGSADLSDRNAGRQFASLGSRLPATFASASDGSIHLVRDPQYLESRSSAVTRMTITPDDMVSVRAPRIHRLDVSVVGADGFIDNGGGITGVTPVRSQAPGLTPAQATSSTELKSMIVRSQDELNWLSGAHWAVLNQPWEFEIELAGNFNVFEPALQYRLAITITPSEFNDPVHGIVYQRMFDLVSAPVGNITRNFYIQSVMLENTDTQQAVRLRVVPELTPTPGVTIPISQPTEYPETVTSDIPAPQPQPLTFTSYGDGTGLVYALVERPGIGVFVVSTNNFFDLSPTWQQRAQLTGMTYGFDFVIDPNDRKHAFIIAGTAQWSPTIIWECTNLRAAAQVWTNLGFVVDLSVGPVGGATQAIMIPGKEPFAGTATSNYSAPTVSRMQFQWHDTGSWAIASVLETTIVQINTRLMTCGYGSVLLGGDADKYNNGNIIQAVIDDNVGADVYRTATGDNYGADVGDWTVNSPDVGTLNPACSVIVPWRTISDGVNSAALTAFAAVPVSGNAETVGLLRTTNAGVGWSNITPSAGGDTYGVFRAAGRSVTSSPLDGRNIALAGHYITGGPNVVRLLISPDGGTSWGTADNFTQTLANAGYYCCESWDRDGDEALAYGGNDNSNVAIIRQSLDWGSSVNSALGNLTSIIAGPSRVKAIQPAVRGEL